MHLQRLHHQVRMLRHHACTQFTGHNTKIRVISDSRQDFEDAGVLITEAAAALTPMQLADEQ